MFKTVKEFADAVMIGMAEHEEDNEFWLSLDKQFDEFLDTASESEKYKLLEEYTLAMEFFNRQVMGIKKGIDLSKIKFYKVRPRRNQ